MQCTYIFLFKIQIQSLHPIGDLVVGGSRLTWATICNRQIGLLIHLMLYGFPENGHATE